MAKTPRRCVLTRLEVGRAAARWEVCTPPQAT